MCYPVSMPYADGDRQRQYQREWLAARRAEWLAEHGPCVDCASSGDLQVDHVDATCKVTHRVWSWAKARRDAELAKCVVRCRSCHVAKTLANHEAVALVGEEVPWSKLTDAIVREARALHAAGWGTNELAARYHVNSGTMSLALRRLKWTHVE